MTSPRVRFAPSPTGYLHVGGARTALFNWLFARHTGGTFVLRIEDTDKERSTDEHTRVILDGLTWLGVTWDEGPFFQGAFAERHRADVERMLTSGAAYRDYHTADELEAERKKVTRGGGVFRFHRKRMALPADEHARREAAGMPYAVRFAMPDEEIRWTDAVHGEIVWQGHDLDDFIVLRSDGSAIYNMAVVSDDIAMGITHVIRGDDHISNTPKQIALYRALGQPVPVFAHVPMILGTDGKKLSKRHGATAVGDYQDLGILPDAMRNFLALLGWSPGANEEILPLEEMVARFTLEHVQKKAAVFDTVKLEWMNGQYLSAMPPEALLPAVKRQLARLGVSPDGRDLRLIIDAVKTRSRTILQLADQVAVRLDAARIVRDDKADALVRKMADRFGANLRSAADRLSQVGEWNAPAAEEALRQLADQTGQKVGDVMQPIRVALTGSTVSEPVPALLEVVGRDESLSRMRRAAGA